MIGQEGLSLCYSIASVWCSSKGADGTTEIASSTSGLTGILTFFTFFFYNQSVTGGNTTTKFEVGPKEMVAKKNVGLQYIFNQYTAKDTSSKTIFCPLGIFCDNRSKQTSKYSVDKHRLPISQPNLSNTEFIHSVCCDADSLKC